MTQRLHLVFGGELVDPSTNAFKNIDEIDIVGMFPNYATATMAVREQVVWVRCSEAKHLDQLQAVVDLLEQDNDPIRFLCTLTNGQDPRAIATPQGQRAVRDFLYTHQPFAMLWIGGILDQASLAPCFAVELPVIVLDGSSRMLTRIMGSWMPHRARTTLAQLHAVFLKDDLTRREFIAGGAREDVIQIAGTLGDAIPVLSHREDDRVDLATVLGTRPVWLAASATPRDTTLLCDAHREAMRRAHRLLMIVAPKSPLDGREIAAQCKGFGFNTSLRSEGAEPDEATQVYVVDDDEGMGLWYRLAPITFLGGTFGNGASENPFLPAALGSVVVHGPAFGQFADRFAELQNANATMPLRHPDDLGGAVAQLLSVDRAAEKANAGWDITSRGAGTAAAVAGLLQNLLDQEGA